jgi:alkanesulfonate monooxygenase SsuD/methylene tetrahydromethanopterin reductase-like flavin-dependent oxidoreductase (luciferase family)
VRFSVGLYTVVGEDERDLVRRWGELERWMPGVLAGQSMHEWRADALVGSVEEVRDRVAAFEALGVEEIVVAPAPLPFAIPDPSMVELFAEAVIGAR